MGELNTQIPLVSIIVPTYNAEPYIEAALGSILQEQQIPLEVIVVNDQSTDQSVQKVLSLNDSRVRIVDNPEKGISSAVNTGLRYAQGTFFARCDADDLYPPNRLFQHITWLKEHPEFSAICGTYAAIDGQGKLVVDFQCGDTEADITTELQNGVTRTHLGTFTIKTELLRQIGGCRPYFLTAEDIDVQLRLSEHGRIGYVPTVSYLYRLHATSTTHVQGSTERNFFNQLARDLQRQRQAQGKDVLDQGSPPSPPKLAIDSPLAVEEHIQGLLLYRAWEEHRVGRRRAAIATGLRAIMLSPTRLSVWKSVLSLVLKAPLS